MRLVFHAWAAPFQPKKLNQFPEDDVAVADVDSVVVTDGDSVDVVARKLPSRVVVLLLDSLVGSLVDPFAESETVVICPSTYVLVQ